MKKPRTNASTSKSFEEALRQKLDEVAASPKNNQWERLEASLNQQDLFRNTGRKLYYGRAAALLLLLLTGGVLTLKHLKETKQNDITKVEIAPSVKNSKTRETAANVLTIPEAANKPKQRSLLKPTKTTGAHAGAKQPSKVVLEDLNTYKRGNKDTNYPTQKADNLLAGAPRSDNTISDSWESKGKNFSGRKNGKTEPAEMPAHIAKVKPMELLPAALGRTLSKNREEKAEFSGLLSETPKNESRSITSSAGAGSGNLGIVLNTRVAMKDSRTIKTGNTAEVIKEPIIAIANQSQSFEDSASRKLNTVNHQQEQFPGDSISIASALNSLPDSLKNSLLSQPVATINSLVADSAAFAKPVNNSLKSLFSVGIYAGPAYFNQNIKLTESGMVRINALGSDTLFSDALKEFDENTAGVFSYHGGIKIGKEIVKGIKIETGLRYYYLKAATTTRYMVADIADISVTGVKAYENHRPLLIELLSEPEYNHSKRVVAVAEHTVRYAYEYLHIPFEFQFYYDVRRWRYFASAGAGVSRLFKNSIANSQPSSVLTVNNKPRARQPFRQWLWSGLFSAGIGYHFTENLLLYGNGEMNAYFSPVTAKEKVAEVRQKAPRIFQASVGITYTFLRK